MSVFAQHVEECLRLRRALGHQLADAARLLPRFVSHLDSLGAATITVEVALDWVQLPDTGPTSSVWMRRMTAVRGFARYMSGIDRATEVPPLGLVTFRRHWRPPFIYDPADVEVLMAEVPRVVPSELRAATFRTMIGLLAATGMRVGEAIALRRADVDWGDGVLVVRAAKFGKSRELPIHPSTVDALGSYADERGHRPVARPRRHPLDRRLPARRHVGQGASPRPHYVAIIEGRPLPPTGRTPRLPGEPVIIPTMPAVRAPPAGRTRPGQDLLGIIAASG
ncbi:MAG: tyrosine-type recombinase/integrase [Acidimicrobiales bacterium]